MSGLRASLAGRIPGLDLARALAIVGMIGAHVGDDGSRGLDRDGWRWLWVVDGRSSALFAVLAGVTLSLMARRDRVSPEHAVVRIAVRGGLLVALGYLLDALGTPVDVVLANLGLMMVLALPALRLPAGAQLALAGLAFTVGSALARGASDGLDGWPLVEKLVSHHYPAVAWVGYLLVGMAVGRSPLAGGVHAARLTLAGVTVAAVGYGGGLALGSPAPWRRGPEVTWASITPHANTTWELVGNAGVAVAVIGACVGLARTTRLMAPLLAFGTMSLSVYTAHVVVIWWVGEDIVWRPSNVAFVTMTACLVAAAALWRRWLGSGPLERAVTRASTAVADATVRAAG